jgi:DNA invertase Pin-like site-specific DNA recombinase
VNGEHKISGGHRARTALVYQRQPTLMQVREHTESTLRQYALADTAVALGWARQDVEVIDRDLGLSGTSAAHREGFRQLMSRVCLGEIGAVFGLEISRLARSNADLARLAELARLTDTLLIDADGVYDLADFSDRLLLGLKSTMRERRSCTSWPGGCRRPSGPPPNAASCVPRCRPGWSTTRTARR